MNYTLRSKNKSLITFKITSNEETILGQSTKIYTVEILNIFDENKHLLPIPLQINLSNNSLFHWLDKRKAPKNRQFVEKILHSIGDTENPLYYVDITHALSLNDAFWVTNDLFDEKWEDFNLYQHPFNEILSQIAFTGYSKKISGVISSPEFTSNGAMKKFWSNRDDGIYLIKGDDVFSREDGRSQATMEFYAKQIAEKLGFNYIDYDLEEFKHRNGNKEIVCKCKLFTSEDIGFVNAYDFFKANDLDLKEESPSNIVTQSKMAKIYGLEKYQDLMIYDAIILNKDRHLGNFGYLIDNNTGEFLKPAPIFDNGISLLLGAAKGDMEKLTSYLQEQSLSYLNFNTQVKYFLQKRHLPKIKSLLNFSFTKHPKHNLDDYVLDKMNKMIHIQAKRILQYFWNKNDEKCVAKPIINNRI